MPLKIKRRGLA